MSKDPSETHNKVYVAETGSPLRAKDRGLKVESKDEDEAPLRLRFRRNWLFEEAAYRVLLPKPAVHAKYDAKPDRLGRAQEEQSPGPDATTDVARKLSRMQVAGKRCIEDAKVVKNLLSDSVTIAKAGGVPDQKLGPVFDIIYVCNQIMQISQSLMQLVLEVIFPEKDTSKVVKLGEPYRTMSRHADNVGKMADAAKRLLKLLNASELKRAVIQGRLENVLDRAGGMLNDMEQLCEVS